MVNVVVKPSLEDSPLADITVATAIPSKVTLGTYAHIRINTPSTYARD